MSSRRRLALACAGLLVLAARGAPRRSRSVRPLERRSGGDRRSGAERRQAPPGGAVERILSATGRRSGRDRRTGVERREQELARR